MNLQTIEIQPITKQYAFDSFLMAGNQSLFSAVQSILLRNSVIQTNIAKLYDKLYGRSALPLATERTQELYVKKTDSFITPLWQA